jgi:hypothetical protein
LAKDWQELTRLTQGKPIVVEKIRLLESDIAIEGSFELPPLARLSAEDQIFIAAFVKCHGSIKEIERIFGISYPTVKKSAGSCCRATELRRGAAVADNRRNPE